MARGRDRKDLYDNRDDLGKLLRQLRIDKRLSQHDIAEFLGVKDVTVSAYENGRIKPPSDKMYRLSQLFGVSLDVMSTRIIGDDAEVETYDSIPELEDAKRRVSRMDEMLYYFKNLTEAQQRAIVNFAKKLTEAPVRE